jgi:hypothetical protein
MGREENLFYETNIWFLIELLMLFLSAFGLASKKKKLGVLQPLFESIYASTYKLFPSKTG